MQDLVAPFYRFINYNYQSNCAAINTGVQVNSVGFKKIFNRKKEVFKGEISIKAQKITGFAINIKGKNIEAKWLIENIY